MPTSPEKKTKGVDPDGEAEAIGEIVIDLIIGSGLCRVEDASDPPVAGEGHLVVWSANSAEQIGTAIMDLMDMRKAPPS